MENREGIPMELLIHVQTNKGVTLEELGQHQKVMLVFLRHFGCTFCRESMADISQRKADIEATGTTIVLVHQVSDAHAHKIFSLYDIENLHRISDPHQELYQAFQLFRAKWYQVFGLRVWWRGFLAGIINGHLIGPEQGDGWQMPGVFIIQQGKIINKFTHEYASDRPDYVDLAACKIQSL
jgi:peroxiredoxin